ncbi:hypothetical protein [Armatimonas rosea]|uniref:Uncharacterized protein n=1 Tax=Armatimonas rosea TaxID=685828 RepID=A0A7W9SVF4_ARMRO|nr:hypothetical protein [Armatimonas rosea]MBB6053572.1 hypothetical protein [Armatimonas rosea]
MKKTIFENEIDFRERSVNYFNKKMQSGIDNVYRFIFVDNLEDVFILHDASDNIFRNLKNKVKIFMSVKNKHRVYDVEIKNNEQLVKIRKEALHYVECEIVATFVPKLSFTRNGLIIEINEFRSM